MEEASLQTKLNFRLKQLSSHRLIEILLMASLLCGGWSQTAWAQSAASLRESGIQYRQAGQLPESIEALRQAVTLEPDHLEGRVMLGWTLHLAGDDRAAATVLQNTIALDPTFVPAFNALGIIYLVNADLAGAILAHSWAAYLAPENEIAYYNLSLAFERSAQFDWAVSHAEKAASLEPDNPHPFVALSIAHWGKTEQEAARQAYQQAIEVDARYTDSTFLDYLDEAGFSSTQIETAKQVLTSLAQ